MKLQITINGNAYAVDVEIVEDEESASEPDAVPRRTAHASGGSHPQSHGGAWDSEGKVCRSPLMGLVIKVHVTPGQAVEANEPILVLEAMKMETNVTAPRAGTVKSVNVAPGGSVKLNQVLMELE